MQISCFSEEKLDLKTIEALLSTCWLGKSEHPNELWETIDSTNNRALELARENAYPGIIVIAAGQSAGRGRGGNVWLSPLNSGIYMSFLIRPKLTISNLPIVTIVTGVAVVRALQSCLGIKIGLKWVNDLIVEGKKVGGILAECVNNSEGLLVIGIGLNLTRANQEISAELEQKIGFLDSYISSDLKQIDRNNLVAAIANELEIALEQMQLDSKLLLDQWRAHSVTLGEQIMAKVGNDEIVGEALDITNKGELIVKTISGNVKLVAGQISIRKMDGTYV
jgi:BirA family biotin operon repressor/biotin-[acetyl-CoA-carboxylase] ligase